MISAAIASAWLANGFGIAAIWTRDVELLAPSFSDKLVAAASGYQTLHKLAVQNKIPVRHVSRLRDLPGLREAVARTGADTLITSMTHQIVPGALLDDFGSRAINFHPALLPFYKGPRPILSLLLDGHAGIYGGMSVHQLTEGIDEGPMIGQRPVPWQVGASIASWRLDLADAAVSIVRSEVPKFLTGELTASAQDPKAGNYRKSPPGEFMITPAKTSGQIRHLFDSIPGAVLRVELPERQGRSSFRVVGVAGRDVPKTGLGPEVRLRTIDLDVADARVRLLRPFIRQKTIGHPALAIWRRRRVRRRP